ncbi:MAG: alkaline phosphatase family protein [Candidatus Tumulicola sp.]
MRQLIRISRALPLAGIAFFPSACGGNGGATAPAALPAAPLHHAAQMQIIRPSGWRTKIKHVVIIVQENRSFNNLFYGFPGANTASYGYDSHKQKVALKPVTIATKWDVEHAADGFFKACDGKGSYPGTQCRMDGFDREIVGCGGSSGPRCPIKYPEYSYVPASETKPYFAMARQYVLADEMFASNFDASSFVSHQYIISGRSEKAVNYPSSSWGCPGGPSDQVAMVGLMRQYPDGYEQPCWDSTTLGDELDKAGLKWAYFAPPINHGDGIWSAYQAINHIYNGPDWSQDVFSPSTQFFSALSNGDLRAVTWIVPTYTNSDHPGNDSKTGPSWVASVVNAIGESPFWDSTAIFVFWDDYGGWFDPAAPTKVDFDGLGLRIPMLVISPYAAAGKVSHVHYEHGSILKFAEDVFGLPRLADSDSRANSPEADCFNFYQAPRKFHPIVATYDRRYFQRQPLDYRPPDSE